MAGEETSFIEWRSKAKQERERARSTRGTVIALVVALLVLVIAGVVLYLSL